MYDVVIVGAGVAGSALAARLGELGRRVALLERDLRPPQLFVGELLQPGGVASLRALGLGECLEGIDAQPNRGFAVIYGDEGQALAYPPHTVGNGATVPTRGYSFHHGRFVASLRKAAMGCRNVDVINGTACRLLEEGEGERAGGVVYRDLEGKECVLSARLVVAADGRNSKLRRCINGEAPIRLSHSAGVLVRGDVLPFSQHGNVFITQPAPLLGYQISQDEVRLLVDLPGELPATRNGGLTTHLREVIAPQLPQPLRDAFVEAVTKEVPRLMPTYVLMPRPGTKPGIVRVGDALNMRHPVTGSGMTVALNDARLLSSLLDDCDLADGAAVDHCIKRFHSARHPLSVTIDMLAGALYDVFRAEDPGLEGMRRAMWRYWKIGGPAADGPMSLLSGMRPRPAMLLLHYFAVALLGVGSNLVPLAVKPRGLSPDFRSASQLAMAAFNTLRPQIRRALAQ